MGVIAIRIVPLVRSTRGPGPVSRLQYRCGHVIVDQAGALPYKAMLFADQDQDRLCGRVAEDAARLVARRAPAERQRRIAGYFGVQYPPGLPAEGVIHDVLAAALFSLRRTVYECASCGRLWLQAGVDTDQFGACTPEEPGAGALRSVTVADGAEPGINQGDAHG